MGGFSETVRAASEQPPGFWESMVGAALATEASRSVFIPAMSAILSYPMRWVGELFAILPGPKEKIPVILMFAGWIAGYAIGYYTYIPQDVAATVGSLAGLGSKVSHDGEKAVVEGAKKAYRGYKNRSLKRPEER